MYQRSRVSLQGSLLPCPGDIRRCRKDGFAFSADGCLCCCRVTRTAVGVDNGILSDRRRKVDNSAREAELLWLNCLKDASSTCRSLRDGGVAGTGRRRRICCLCDITYRMLMPDVRDCVQR